MSKPCPFCDPKIYNAELVAKVALGYAKWDRTPASPGHALVIPKSHISSYFELDPGVALDLHMLILKVQHIIDQQFHPAGYNIGVNDGAAAGQTVSHLHIHVIPRYEGDIADPRGGIRRMFPDDPYVKQLGN